MWLATLLSAALSASCSVLYPFSECDADTPCSDGAICDDGVCRSGGEDGVVSIAGQLEGDARWTADNVYRLTDLVLVPDGVTLTIDAGARVQGVERSALIVLPGGRLDARGTADNPIVFTSDKPVGERTRGDWGGVALLGRAPVNGSTPLLEGVDLPAETITYGGDAPGSTCGTLTYARIEFAGFALQRNEELNGLTLAGCGSGTDISYVQIHLGQDDGLEIFGGTVQLHHIVVTRAKDDSLDWDRGWAGGIQFLAIQRGGLDNSSDPSGIEASSLKAGSEGPTEPISDPVVSNVTLIGSGDTEVDERALYFKDGTQGTITNVLVADWGREVISVKGEDSVAPLAAGTLQLGTTLVGILPGTVLAPGPEDESDDDGGFNEAEWVTTQPQIVTVADPAELRIGRAADLTEPDWVPGTRASESEDDLFPPADDRLVTDQARYYGAFEPGEVPWTSGWTDYPLN